jgi:uncharacterized membrane protein YccC
MVGAVIGMLSAFAGTMFPRPRTLLLSLVLMPIPMVAGMAIGLLLAPIHLAALASLVAVLALGGYLRRFGPRGFLGGQLLFMGDFFGFFLSKLVTIHDLGWLAAIIGVGSLVAILAQFTLFFPSRRMALRRMRRSFGVRSSRLSAAASAVLDDPGDPAKQRRLHRLLIRLNETALMIDAQLADPAALPEGATAAALHQRVFDAELTMTNIARFAERLSTEELPDDLLQRVGIALRAIAGRDADEAERAANRIRQLLQARRQPGPDSDPTELVSRPPLSRTTTIVLHRFTTSVLGHAAVIRWMQDEPNPSSIPDEAEFDPAVELSGGWLPGSSKVSATASTERGARWADRARLEPYARVSIQMAVAVTAAIVVGSLISPQRFYWAVIATFVTFLGAHNATEQIRKGMLRVVGTVVGVFVGVILGHLLADHTRVSVLVILVALFFGLYLLRVSYAFMTIGITIMVSQLYVQLNEFSDSLLLLRLFETAVGAAVAALTVTFVLPIRMRHVVAVATREYLENLSEVVDLAVGQLCEPGEDRELRAAARRLDVAYQALESATSPSRGRIRLPGASGAGLREKFWYAATASRNYARNLVIDTRSSTALPAEIGEDLRTAAKLLATSTSEVIDAIQEGRDFEQRSYLRSASLFDRVAVALDDQDVTTSRQLALRDLELIDGSLASIAGSLPMQIRALDDNPEPATVD